MIRAVRYTPTTRTDAYIDQAMDHEGDRRGKRLGLHMPMGHARGLALVLLRSIEHCIPCLERLPEERCACCRRMHELVDALMAAGVADE